MKHILSLAVVFTLAVAAYLATANAYFEPTSTGAKPREMNGIVFDKYKDFTKTWHLVTVRYRQDSGEQRFTYANDIAFNAMKSFKPDYPEGSMFAKVAFATDEDPAFSSSKVPSGAKRYQFMVKDKKKYASTDNWGYALFDQSGNLYDEDMVAKTQSCVACHQIVPERDYVFSRQMLLNSDSFAQATEQNTKSASVVQFATMKFKESPKAFKAFSEKYDVFNSLTGRLRETAFSGTLDEVVPLLGNKSRLTRAPSALLVDEKNFSLVLPQPESKKCLEQNANLKAYRVVIQFNAKTVRNSEICL